MFITRKTKIWVGMFLETRTLSYDVTGLWIYDHIWKSFITVIIRDKLRRAQSVEELTERKFKTPTTSSLTRSQRSYIDLLRIENSR